MPKLFFNPFFSPPGFHEHRLTFHWAEGLAEFVKSKEEVKGVEDRPTEPETKAVPVQEEEEEAIVPPANVPEVDEAIEVTAGELDVLGQNLEIRKVGERMAPYLSGFIELSGMDFTLFKNRLEKLKGTKNSIVTIRKDLVDIGWPMALGLSDKELACTLQLFSNTWGENLSVDFDCGSRTRRGFSRAIDFVQEQQKLEPHNFNRTQIDKITAYAKEHLKIDLKNDDPIWNRLWKITGEKGIDIEQEAIQPEGEEAAPSSGLEKLFQEYEKDLQAQKAESVVVQDTQENFGAADKAKIRDYAENRGLKINLEEGSIIWDQLWKIVQENEITFDQPLAILHLFNEYLAETKKAVDLGIIQFGLSAAGLNVDQKIVDKIYAFQKELQNDPIQKIYAAKMTDVVTLFLVDELGENKLIEKQGHAFWIDEQMVIVNRAKTEGVSLNRVTWENLWHIHQQKNINFDDPKSVDELFEVFQSSPESSTEEEPFVPPSAPPESSENPAL